jgi:hypothetical protein
MKIKLRKDAPWPEVTMPEGQVVSKTKWIDEFESPSLGAIKKYLEYSEKATPIEKEAVEIIEEPIIEEVAEETVGEATEEVEFVESPKTFSTMTKKELQSYCDENSIEYESTDKKADLLEKVLAFDDPVLASDEIV